MGATRGLRKRLGSGSRSVETPPEGPTRITPSNRFPSARSFGWRSRGNISRSVVAANALLRMADSYASWSGIRQRKTTCHYARQRIPGASVSARSLRATGEGERPSRLQRHGPRNGDSSAVTSAIAQPRDPSHLSGRGAGRLGATRHLALRVRRRGRPRLYRGSRLGCYTGPRVRSLPTVTRLDVTPTRASPITPRSSGSSRRRSCAMAPRHGDTVGSPDSRCTLHGQSQPLVLQRQLRRVVGC